MELTDHAVFIAAMRREAAMLRVMEGQRLLGAEQDRLRKDAEFMECAAALLEVHDSTGISLDDWRGPRELVETALRIVGGTFTENGV